MLEKLMIRINNGNLAQAGRCKKIPGYIVFAVVVGLVMAVPAWANNIQVGNAVLTDQNTTVDYINIRVDISWDNSWRLSGVQAPGNWDAAWVFAKWKVQGSTDWGHCTLSTTDGDHTAPAGSEIDASFTKDNNGTGVFIYRSSAGTGSNNWSDVKLRWNYGTDGMGDNDAVEVRVFAIEMVHVPAGNFYLGDGSSYGTFRRTDSNTPAVINPSPVHVKSENTNFDDAQLEGAGILVDGDGGIDTDGTASVDNPDYPTGYGALYLMKYEISQEQYADFLNTLTSTQDGNRYPGEYGSYRYTISGTIGSRTADAPDRACNWLSWMDGAAYADWSGLRPMTELEFEKASRGTQNAVAGEYAWGNTNIAGSPYTLSNDGSPYEGIATGYATDPTGNASYSTTDGSINGPLRSGIFATNSSSRAEAGASYYGVMEMSGNLQERPVTLGNPAGRGFAGSHGDGLLSANGNATNSDWPGHDGIEVSGAYGSGLRGGDWSSAESFLHVSDRRYAASANASRYSNIGFRAARSP